MQQGSSPHVGLPTGAAVPIGSQQQQPLQSVHEARVALGWQTAAHAAPSPAEASLAASPLEPSPASLCEPSPTLASPPPAVPPVPPVPAVPPVPPAPPV